MSARNLIVEQIELLTFNLRVATLLLRDAQEVSLFTPCRFGDINPCLLCKQKRFILRERYQ